MYTTKHKQQGNALLKTIVFIPGALILLALAYFGFCEARKAYWDKQVKMMCEKDGGVKVFEKISISQADYKKLGGIDGAIPIYSKSSSLSDALYFSEEQTKHLNALNPTVRRAQTTFIRRADNKPIAQQIYYARVGGDFPSWGHPTSTGCDFPMGDISKQIFNIQGE